MHDRCIRDRDAVWNERFLFSFRWHATLPYDVFFLAYLYIPPHSYRQGDASVNFSGPNEFCSQMHRGSGDCIDIAY